MSKHLLSGLTFISVLLATASGTHAKLASNVNSLTIQGIDRAIPQQPSSHPQIASAGDRSMNYVEMGMAAQKEGNEKQALEYYYQAVQIDQTNAVAFLLAGNLLGDTEDGIACVKAAGILFQAQENQEGYELAMTWLQEHGVESL
jgi:tetratricopeptide (TPR) repeat protein